MRYLKRLVYSVLVSSALLFTAGSWSTIHGSKRTIPSQPIETSCFPTRDVEQASEVSLLIAKYAAVARVSSKILTAVIAHESGFVPNAYNPNDPSYGLGQVMPKYWRYSFIDQCGSEATSVTLMDPEVNICYAAHILRHFQDKYGPVAGIDAYNNGSGAARGYSDRVLYLMGG